MNGSADPELPSRSSPYTPLRRLGEGASGSVDLAIDRRTGSKVARKRFHLDAASVLDEANLLAGIEHPGIVRLKDAYRDADTAGGGAFVAVYEYVEGVDLVTATRGADNGSKLARFAESMRALAFVHRRRLLHRDLKPANILVRRDGVAPERALLLDFGFATRSGDAAGLRGSLRYLAPEAIEGAPASERTDLYAMGIVLYELLVGETPSAGLDAVATMRKHSGGDLELPASVRASSAPPIVELVATLLRRDPGRRLGSADEANQLLERAGVSLPAALEELTARIQSLAFQDADALANELSIRLEQRTPRVVLAVPEGSDDAIVRLRIELARRGMLFDGPMQPRWCDARDPRVLAELAALDLDDGSSTIVVVDDATPLPTSWTGSAVARVESPRPDDATVLEAVVREFGIELPERLLPVLRATRDYTPRSIREGLQHLADRRVIRALDGRISCEAWRPVDIRRDPRGTAEAAQKMAEFSALEREWTATLAHAPLEIHPAALARVAESLRNPAAPLALERLRERGVVIRFSDERVLLSSHTYADAARGEGDAGTTLLRKKAVALALLDDSRNDPLRRGEAGMLLAEIDPNEAARVLLAAGKELRVGGRAAEAWRFLAACALDLGSHLESSMVKTAERWLADTASFLGDNVGATNHANHALARGGGSGANAADDDARCRAILARAALRGGDLELARLELDRGLAVERAAAPTRAVLESLASLLLRRLSRFDEALAAARRAVEVASGELSAELAAAWMELANTLDDMGDVAGSRDAYARARDIGAAIGRHEVFAHAASNLGRSLFLHGETTASIELFEAALLGYEAAAAPALAEGVLVNLLWARNAIGDLDGARALVLRARASFRRGSSLYNRAMFLRHAAETEWRGGGADAAERLLEESVDLRRRIGSPGLIACGEAQLGRLESSRGDDAAARTWFARALINQRRDRSGSPDCEVLAMLLESYALRGSPRRAARLAKRALKLEPALRPRRFDVWFHAFAAVSAWRLGDRVEASASVEAGMRALGSDGPDGAAALLLGIGARLAAEAGQSSADAKFDEALRRVSSEGFAFERALVLLLRGGARFERGAALAAARNPEDVRRSLEDLGGARQDADRADELLRGVSLATSGLAFAAWRSRMSDSESKGVALGGFEGLDRRMRGMERLLEINKAINSELDPQRLLNLILDSAILLCSARRGFCVLVRGNQVEVKVARNFSQQDVAHPEFEISHSVARGVARSGEPILTSNALSDSRLRSIASIHELRLLSILCVPLRSRNEVLGSIYLDHPDIVDRFDAVDLALLTDFAWAAGIALERARLYQENLERTRELLVAKQENERLNAELMDRVKEQHDELVEVKETIEAERSVQALRYDYRTIVTRCEKMREVLGLIDRITETDFPVLVRGESGTGKELVARAIHYNGKRAEKNFVAVNCAAMTESLIESVLFGYVKGAFTGADRDRKGLFEVAHEGTLFLDEIGDMTLEVQKRLLRVLQYGEFYRIGAKDPIKVDVRVLCATHRDVKAMIPGGLFRQDLYYRISVAEVHLPPLRERLGDVRLLIDHVIREATAAGHAPPCHFSPGALSALERYSWPGNIRELQNEVKRLLFLRTERPTVEVADLPAFMRPSTPSDGPDSRKGSLKEQLLSVEQAIVARALEDASGNKSEAARRLGISIRGLYKILERGRIASDDDEDGDVSAS